MKGLSFFRGRFRLGREYWHFEGQAGDTRKCIENLNWDIDYKHIKRVPIGHILRRCYLKLSAFISQIFNIISRLEIGIFYQVYFQ